MNKHITSLISQYFGKFASCEFTPWFQKIVNQSYVSLMGLDMSEFHSPSTYKTLNKLFTRKLREPRHFSLDSSDFISPCDSLISECGDMDEDYAMQIKGMQYKTDELLGENFSKEEKKAVHNGQFINFYLSPKDYHRYHIPMNLRVLKVVHIPGKLYPVNMPSLKKRLNLFIENERVVIKCETLDKKIFYMVLVGALNVGVMQVAFEPRIKTDADAHEQSVYEYEELYLNKGDDFGCFEMGSTIVIISEENMFDLLVAGGKSVRYGQTIAKYRE
ncbi:phosphatidylserine decarboxylase [bacterium]|nr:phosphatidylserine decarboxylase [bacterium]MBU1884938.1 phosphatidylserine decarboxylase [bacterium]